MVSQTREITCLTLVSRRGLSSGPRKYLETTTLVAICDHDTGISQSFCSKTTSPFSLAMEAVRLSHCTSSKGCTPARVKRRSTTRPRPSLTAPRDAAGRRGRLVARPVSVLAVGWGASEEGGKGAGLSTEGPSPTGDFRLIKGHIPRVTPSASPAFPPP